MHLRRMEFGFPHIRAESEIDLYYGLGYAHGRDLHMWLLKLIEQGRASECLQATPDLIETDKYVRWIDLAGDTEHDLRLRQRAGARQYRWRRL
ncbi:MAG: penicillin acylase family protein [Anaerolineales bacterium]|nr:penicillin acylase family protein [Anaerolineales bacterium]